MSRTDAALRGGWPARPVSLPSEPVAVVGMACRFPGAAGVPQYWELLRKGRSAIGPAPRGRWPEAFPGGRGPRRGGFLERIDLFDPLFFGISPREAVHMDPQQRLMLELAFEAVEDAGMPLESLKGSLAGVFVGAMWSDYSRLTARDRISEHTLSGQSPAVIAARISYTLGLEGPCLTLDTTSSSSLVAVHLACQSIRAGESEAALAGGVNLIAAPESTLAAWRLNTLDPRGQARPFDADAGGYVRGEGGGLVLLKPLRRAKADGDAVYCVISGGAVSHDGRSVGLAAPRPESQERTLKQAYRQAGIGPGQVQFVETHGTGTVKGDRAEAEALAAVFGPRPSGGPLLLGSAKANIGHLEAAAGVAGLIKAALAIERGLIPSTPGFERHPEDFPLRKFNLRVLRSPAPWPDPDAVRIAGVSSFGIGGTNCHLALQSPPPRRPAPRHREAGPESSDGELFLLTAQDAPALRQRAALLLAFLKEAPAIACRDLCHTLRRRTSHLRQRMAFTFRHRSGLLEQLESFADGENRPGVRLGSVLPEEHRILMLEFPESEPKAVHRKLRQPSWEALSQHWRRVAEIAGGDGGRIETAPPAVREFALQTGFAELCRSWGLRPNLLAGAGSGRFGAACLAGAMSIQQALDELAAWDRHSNGKSGETQRWWRQNGDPTSQPFTPASNGQAEMKPALRLDLGFKEDPPSGLHDADHCFRPLQAERPRGVLLEAAATAATLGWQLDWDAVFPEGGSFVRLPAYPWQRASYWIGGMADKGLPDPPPSGRPAESNPTGDSPAAPPEIDSVGQPMRAEPAVRFETLGTYLKSSVGEVLQFDLDGADLDRPLIELGLDSLMAMELEARLERDLGTRIDFQELLEGLTLRRLALRVGDDWNAFRRKTSDANRRRET